MEHNIIVYYINMIRTFVNVGPYDTIYDGKKKRYTHQPVYFIKIIV